MDTMLTERQGKILNGIVQEYIRQAQPVSSQLLEKKHKLGISPATVRNEMQKLTEEGFLFQPHTSAGRIPTDRGYRFFVDRLLEKELKDFGQSRAKEIEDPFGFVKEMTKFLAEESSELALGYSAEQKIIWKEGWGELFQEPEFSQAGFAAEFAQMLDDFEKNIDELLLPEIRIYIGKENPVSKTQDFSIVTIGFGDGLFAILGPKRMSYNKNIRLLCDLWKKT